MHVKIILKQILKKCFVRDPDGYYIEFCSCQYLEDYLTEQMGRSQAIASNYDWSVYELLSTMKVNRFWIFVMFKCGVKKFEKFFQYPNDTPMLHVIGWYKAHRVWEEGQGWSTEQVYKT